MNASSTKYLPLLVALSLANTAGAAQYITNGGPYPAPVQTDDNNTLRNGWTDVNEYVGTKGIQFTVGTTDICVTDLGVYDGPNSAAANVSGYTPDGLLNSHNVAIWSLPVGGNPSVALATVVIPSGSSTTTLGDFRYLTLGTPLILTAGTTYIIGAGYTAQDTTVNGDVLRNAFNGTPAVTIGGSDFAGPIRGIYQSGSQTPFGYGVGTLDTDFGNAQPYISGNFQYKVIPEPSAAVLITVGLLGLIRRRR